MYFTRCFVVSAPPYLMHPLIWPLVMLVYNCFICDTMRPSNRKKHTKWYSSLFFQQYKLSVHTPLSFENKRKEKGAAVWNVDGLNFDLVCITPVENREKKMLRNLLFPQALAVFSTFISLLINLRRYKCISQVWN